MSVAFNVALRSGILFMHTYDTSRSAAGRDAVSGTTVRSCSSSVGRCLCDVCQASSLVKVRLASVALFMRL